MQVNSIPRRRDESSWIAFLTALFGDSGAEVGIGDDCAILPPARYAVSTDTLVEGVDFQRDWAPPEALGWKALAANLSDLAASGARPRFLLLTIGLPPDIEDSWVEKMAGGMQRLAAAEGVGLAGGDLSASPSGLYLSLTVLGLQENAPLLRSGGEPGDLLAVGGALGGARAGLRLFQDGRRLPSFDPDSHPPGEGRLLTRFYTPPSQSALGLFLASRRLATSCIDLSDGLASDLGKLCAASACGALVEAWGVPLETGIAENCPGGETPLKCALRGGEDQVLLFAVRAERARELAEAPIPTHLIGRLTVPEEGLAILDGEGVRHPLFERGHDHFAP